MAHIQPVKTAAGKTRYRARWTDPSGVERAKTFELKRDAQRHLDEVSADMLTGRYCDPRSGRVLLKVYVRRWAASRNWEPSTRHQTESRIDRHILPVFGDRATGSVRTSEVAGWAAKLSQNLAPSTARGVFDLLDDILSTAVADKVIGVNPCDGVSPPERGHSEVTIPTPETVSALLGAAPSWFKAAVLLGAGQGTRQSEASGLALDMVTFPRGTAILGVQRDRKPTLRVERQLACVTGQPTYLKPPKSRAGIRTLPLAGPVGDALAELVREHPPATVTLPWGRPDGPLVEVALLFTVDGQPMDRWAWSRTWRAVQAAAGVSGVDFHHLRHYAVSSLIRHGASVKEVQHFAGHARSKTTLDVYGHLWSDSEDRVRSALDVALDFGKIQNLTDVSRTDHGS
jgi:integrase